MDKLFAYKKYGYLVTVAQNGSNSFTAKFYKQKPFYSDNVDNDFPNYHFIQWEIYKVSSIESMEELVENALNNLIIEANQFNY